MLIRRRRHDEKTAARKVLSGQALRLDGPRFRRRLMRV